MVKLGEGLPIKDGLAWYELLVVRKSSEDVRSEVKSSEDAWSEVR